jgi:hypothetical protein
VFRKVRSRLSYANVTATFAVFLGLGGGAYALTGVPDSNGIFYGCVSAKTGALRVVQSAKSCRKARTVTRNRKKVRLPGELAIAWNQKGAVGATGAVGAPGPAGPAGPAGSAGPAGPFPATLASGTSLTGAYRSYTTNAGDPVGDAETFTYPLVSKPIVHFIAPSTQPPTECPGTPDDPKAAPGHLCVFAAQGNSGVSIANPETNIAPDASRHGFVVFDNFNGAFTSGSWAVTAP